MHQQHTDPVAEVKRMQRCMNDLVGVLALPAVWSVSEPSRILDTFLDALMEMLDLDFLYAHVQADSREAPVDALRTAPRFEICQSRDEIMLALKQGFEEVPHTWHERVCRHLGGQEISVFPIRMGIEGELGLIIAGSQRLGFPEQPESLVLHVAANQLAIGLQHALRLYEQKRVASELDLRVAERTKELAETNKKLQLQVGLLQRLPVVAWTLQPDGTPDFVNQVWLEYSGQTFAFVCSYPEAWMTAVHPDDREAASRIFWEGVRAGRPFAIETRFRAQDGTYRWHLNRAVVIRDAEGKVLKFVGTSTDIDDRKRAEDELRRSEARYRVVVETASDAVVSIDASGTIILANPAMKRIFRHAPEELIGKPLTVLMPEAMRKLHEAGSKRYLENGTKHLNWQGTEVTALRADGEEFPAEISFGEMTSGEQKILTGFIRDISEKKSAEEELRKTQAELSRMMRVMTIGQLTASIAHEVSQPLSGIIMNASTCLRMLKSDPPNIDGAQETALRTIRDGNRASEVITRLRTLFSKRQIDVEPLDLNEAAREVISLLSGELQRNKVILKQELYDNLPTVNGDRIQLQQVILNLLRNASDAMSSIEDRPRQMVLRTEREGEHVRLSVQDSGVGFTREVADQMFESFYTTKSDGMGVGLSVSRSIIEANHGRLWATANDGPGATFAFSIPCEYRPALQERPSEVVSIEPLAAE